MEPTSASTDWGRNAAEAFEQAALALTAIVVTPSLVRLETSVDISCEAMSLDDLLVEWLNAVIFEMSNRQMVSILAGWSVASLTSISRFPIVSWRARRFTRISAGPIWAQCAPESTVRSPTARFSRTWCAKPLHAPLARRVTVQNDT